MADPAVIEQPASRKDYDTQNWETELDDEAFWGGTADVEITKRCYSRLRVAGRPFPRRRLYAGVSATSKRQ